MDNQLPTSTPEAEGIPASAILDFVEEAEATIDALHSLMLLRHGRVIASGWWSPHGPEHPHMLFSLSKSFTSTAVGLAVADGLLSVDDRVLSFFPEDAPRKISENLAAMRVRHLLTMTTGHDDDSFGYLHRRKDGNWPKAFLRYPVKLQPGTHFLYDTGASYMLSAIVQKVTGQKLLDYLGPRILAPLGIEGAKWETCPRGINLGGTGLNVKTEDIARFGQLYLQKGVWRGQRLLPEAWVHEATSYQVPNLDFGSTPEWQQGYGYQFWRCRHNVYRGDGAFGQFCIVMPDQEAVLAITSGVPNMQAVLDLVWKHLLPAMRPTSLPEDAAAVGKLAQKLSSLALRPVEGEPSSPLAAEVSGKAYVFPANKQGMEAISFDMGEPCTLTTRQGGREHRVPIGSGQWLTGSLPHDGSESLPVAASGAWTAPDTYRVKFAFYETPFCPIVTCRFEGDTVTYDARENVSFGRTKRPTLIARASSGTSSD